jgi:hypothetical protein
MRTEKLKDGTEIYNFRTKVKVKACIEKSFPLGERADSEHQ